MDARPVVEHKDVVVGILGASAALTGLALVFLGLVVTNLLSFTGGTKKAILDRYRRPGLAILGTSGVGVVCMTMASLWLVLLREHQVLYVATVALFFAQLFSMVGATAWSVRRIMWG